MTEVTLRIRGVPEAISAAVVGFSSFESALQASRKYGRSVSPSPGSNSWTKWR